ncbi:MAG: 2-C-methyl-D-erythritol 4-phosphate cytidylyltransferase [Candidatus Omnitrophica bacterium]|jgi:2-C-methyl-D-erythritol 4-phosphate cytidylyltransferase|nr:2-C-methyl-D-erythritol 4-phosphate cytidylyltransferase [Candidatus Omnitrophota bacterium]
MPSNVGAVIVCAGKGKRLGADKAAIKLEGKPLFYHTYKLFKDIKAIKQIVIVLRKKNFTLAQKLIKDKRVSLAEGGVRRQDSVFAGLSRLDKNIGYVLIHDGARPFTPRAVIVEMLKNVKKYPAVICAVKSRDTLKGIRGNFVKNTLNRNDIAMVQTPQAFKKSLLLDAYQKFNHRNTFDDAELFEFMKKKVRIVNGSHRNIKITYPQDMVLAKALLKTKGTT